MEYLVVAGDEEPASQALAAQARARGMRLQTLAPGVWIATGGPRPPRIVRVADWLLIGDVLDRRQNPFGPATVVDDEHSFERKLMRRFWGRYVGVRLDGRARVSALLRDPSGALECVSWGWGALTLVASDAADWLVSATRPDWRIAYDRVAHALRDSLGSWGQCLLDGPTVPAPGCLQMLPDSEPAVNLWEPHTFARLGDAETIKEQDAAAILREAVDETVAGLARPGGACAAELSGGLDSAIVGSSLTAGDHHVGLWLNAFGEEPGSDERSYAQAMAARLGVSLTPVPRSPLPLTEAMLTALTHGIRPGFNALDAPNDAVWSTRLREAGATVLMTGKGGDAVFVQGADIDVFCDLWRKRGWCAVLSPSLPALARWNGRSVWSLVAAARAQAAPRDQLGRALSFIPPSATAPPLHPWLAGAADLGPAKRYQIAGVINGITFSSPSRQSSVVELLHPLLGQPVVETCLALSAQQLTMGRRDRALARETFRDRLTPAIADRRSKGEMTAYYGRRLAASLDVVRPWLLEGRLASKGLIDGRILEGLLTPESLIWRGRTGEIMTAVAIEAWVRTWESRLLVTA